tara:strand:- start:548 stop:796 length:249 start_codon:yes stop_codon:yes gene_type:complete
MNTSAQQLEIDVDWLDENVGLEDDDQYDEILGACEELGGISAQYFCEEFVFVPDDSTPEEVQRLHDDEYLNIAVFNALFWEH